MILERELEEASKHRPISLVLPYIPIELQGAGLPRIAKQLHAVGYLKNVIVTVGHASIEDFRDARRFFSGLPQKPKLIWCTGPRMQAIYDRLKQEGIDVGEDGKGRSAWIAYGYILALENSHVIALHDCDIVTYERELLARLCYPVAHPNIGFEFCKGYYSRVTDQLHGRVTRLFVSPLLRSLKATLGSNPLEVPYIANWNRVASAVPSFSACCWKRSRRTARAVSCCKPSRIRPVRTSPVMGKRGSGRPASMSGAAPSLGFENIWTTRNESAVRAVRRRSPPSWSAGTDRCCRPPATWPPRSWS